MVFFILMLSCPDPPPHIGPCWLLELISCGFLSRLFKPFLSDLCISWASAKSSTCTAFFFSPVILKGMKFDCRDSSKLSLKLQSSGVGAGNQTKLGFLQLSNG